MSSSSPLPLPVSLPPFPSSFSVFVLRHGERVDQAFGNDWIQQAFKIYRKKEDKKEGNEEGGEQQDNEQNDPDADGDADSSPSSSPSPDSLSSSPYLSDPIASSLLPPLDGFHHATYVRFNLNMPRNRSTHLPRRDPAHYLYDSPLTECGHWQAFTVGESLQGMRITSVYASPALRSVQTANEAVLAMGLDKHADFHGIRIEPALFEYMGWYSAQPQWIDADTMKEQGLCVDANYKPISSPPAMGEGRHDWYIRSSLFIQQLFSSYDGSQPTGNILLVGHAGTADVISYSLLTGYNHPTLEELELGSRTRLYANYCGIARIKYSHALHSWVIGDDSHFDIHNTANEPFSFQLTYQSHERQYSMRENQLGFSPNPLRIPMVHHCPKEERVIDLNFRRSFGPLLDLIYYTSGHLNRLGAAGLKWLSDLEFDYFIRKHTKTSQSLIEAIIPEWAGMAAYCDGHTHLHVLKCFLCIPMVLGHATPPASADASPLSVNGFPFSFPLLSFKDKNIISWAILLHDIAKVVTRSPTNGHILRDPIHPFHSAIAAARILAREGYMKRSGEVVRRSQLDQWEATVRAAIVDDEGEREYVKQNERKEEILYERALQNGPPVLPATNIPVASAAVGAAGGSVDAANIRSAKHGLYNSSLYAKRHDNSQLPRIIEELHDLFGSNSVASDIIFLILFHQSLAVLEDFPPAAPLLDHEIHLYFTPRLMYLMGILNIVDSASYNMNRPLFQSKCVDTIKRSIVKYMSRLDPNGEYQPNKNYKYAMEFQSSWISSQSQSQAQAEANEQTQAQAQAEAVGAGGQGVSVNNKAAAMDFS